MGRRRKPYSKLVKKNQIRADHVKGMGDVVLLQFQCLNPECEEIINIREDSISEDFDIECPECSYIHRSGDETVFYEYDMRVTTDGVVETVSEGEFTIFHDEYIESAQRSKYCIVCNTIRPLESFDNHSARKSGKQGECRQCKKIYNSIKNGTRLTDQHREASQRRRLLLDIASNKVNSREVYKKYGYKCFSCNKDLSDKNIMTARERPLDHTLPIYYLWPLTTQDATLLCQDCNGQKSGTWPSKFYNDSKLRLLSIKTGISYELLAGEPIYNPDAIESLKNPEYVDALLVKYTKYMTKTIIPLRNRLLKEIGFDFFNHSNIISQQWVDQANSLLGE